MKFTSKQAMKRHYQTKHVLGKPYACDVCSERFWRKLQLKLHKVRHTGEYPHRCEHCGHGFVNLKAMRSHRCKHHAQKCPDCAKEFLHWSELVTHRRLEHPTQYRCEQCDKQFNTKRNLNLHGRVHRKQEDSNGQDLLEVLVYECPYAGCPRFYEHERNLHAHVRSKHESRKREDLVCPVAECGKLLATKQKLEQHRKLHLRATKAGRSVRKLSLTDGLEGCSKATGTIASEETDVVQASGKDACSIPVVPVEASNAALLDITTDSEVETGNTLQVLLENHVQHFFQFREDAFKNQTKICQHTRTGYLAPTHRFFPFGQLLFARLRRRWIVVSRRCALLQPDEIVAVFVLDLARSAPGVPSHTLEDASFAAERFRHPQVGPVLNVVALDCQLNCFENCFLHVRCTLLVDEGQLLDRLVHSHAAHKRRNVPHLLWAVLDVRLLVADVARAGCFIRLLGRVDHLVVLEPPLRAGIVTVPVFRQRTAGVQIGRRDESQGRAAGVGVLREKEPSQCVCQIGGHCEFRNLHEVGQTGG
uniref:C2H2-type domain-containing protein n=1 Tax=Anopheles christyi TaxID=43041 RepID=A0A182K3F6_9DIPT